jgi:glycogen debranching enzyme
MPLITVGPPQLVIHQGELVFATDPDGQLSADGDKGLFYRDTRMVALWTMYANGERWKLLNGAAITHYAGRVFLTNPPILTHDGIIAEHTLSLVLGRWIDGGVHEDVDITNHGMQPVRFNFELVIRADFGDVFEVKSDRVVRRGQITTDWHPEQQCLCNAYHNGDFYRAVRMRAKNHIRAGYANGRITYDITLQPGETWHACLLSDIEDGDYILAAPGDCTGENCDSKPGQALAAWRSQSTGLQTPNEEVYRTWRQAVDDLAALRLPIDWNGETFVVPAAGLPWFAALFGRDSLIVALQTAPLNPEFLRGALGTLGAAQATVRDDYRDAEPGKILHEMRRGELAHFKLIPHTPYYGTADATPLYLMALHEAWRWTGDRGLIERMMPAAEGCLAWIDNYGDRDGDGFQEYQTRSSAGYENVAWKDSGDAVLYPDGTHVKGPKALCELQGYVYAAWQGMAEIFEVLGDAGRSAALRGKAAALAQKFDAAFWNEEFGGFAYALDGDKKQVLVSVSNIGHCLWTGLILPERAGRVVDRLMSEQMFSGWGVRTLSQDHVAYNPYSYHNGSVWPHDNGIVALGMARYGFHEAAAQVARAISAAASYFEMHQMPELFAGIVRDDTGFPVQFLGSNVPQAWAAGSTFMMMQALIGLQPDAAAGRLYIDPHLPRWLPEVVLRNIKVGREVFDLRVAVEEGSRVFEVLSGPRDAVALRPRNGSVTPVHAGPGKAAVPAR